MDFVTAARYARAIEGAALSAKHQDAILASTHSSEGRPSVADSAQDKLDRVTKDLESVKAYLEQDTRARELLTSPMILSKTKERIADLLGGRLSLDPLSIQALKVTARKGRMNLLALILHRLRRLNDDHHNRVRIDVTFAREPVSAVVEHLRSRLASLLKKEVVFEPRVDSALLGGVRLRIEDTIIDGSLRHQLDHFRREVESRHAGQ